MRRVLFSCFLIALAACGKPEPIRIGFIGGVSGRFADLGTAGRNGALLAVEWRNAAGGIAGRPVELLVRDDKQDNATAIEALKSLDAAGVTLILGPMTSSVATAIVPAAQETGLVLIGGTVTTTSLSGKDDVFFRILSSTSTYGRGMARYQRQRMGLSRAAVIADLANRDYTLSWVSEYQHAFEESGGILLDIVEYDSRQPNDYSSLAQRLLEHDPDVISLVCNTVDAGMLIQKLRQSSARPQLAGSGWTATERLIELGGEHAEGMLVEQYFDRTDPSAAYQTFHTAYLQRFGTAPGYASVAGFDAANVALEALQNTRDRNQIKQALLKRREFKALQGIVSFDTFGDASRPQFMSQIRNARFEATEP